MPGRGLRGVGLLAPPRAVPALLALCAALGATRCQQSSKAGPLEAATGLTVPSYPEGEAQVSVQFGSPDRRSSVKLEEPRAASVSLRPARAPSG